jgi:hypothetical protein
MRPGSRRHQLIAYHPYLGPIVYSGMSTPYQPVDDRLILSAVREPGLGHFRCDIYPVTEYMQNRCRGRSLTLAT